MFLPNINCCVLMPLCTKWRVLNLTIWWYNPDCFLLISKYVSKVPFWVSLLWPKDEVWSRRGQKSTIMFIYYTLSPTYISLRFIQVSSRSNYVDFKCFFDNITPTTSCNSNIVLHGLTIVAWAHTRTIDFVYTYK